MTLQKKKIIIKKLPAFLTCSRIIAWDIILLQMFEVRVVFIAILKASCQLKIVLSYIKGKLQMCLQAMTQLSCQHLKYYIANFIWAKKLFNQNAFIAYFAHGIHIYMRANWLASNVLNTFKNFTSTRKVSLRKKWKLSFLHKYLPLLIYMRNYTCHTHIYTYGICTYVSSISLQLSAGLVF